MVFDPRYVTYQLSAVSYFCLACFESLVVLTTSYADNFESVVVLVFILVETRMFGFQLHTQTMA